MTVPLPSQIKRLSKPVATPTPRSTKLAEKNSPTVAPESESSQSVSSEKETGSAGSTEKKTPFVRKEHLTERPFKNHEGLQALRDSLHEGPKGRKPSGNKRPRRK